MSDLISRQAAIKVMSKTFNDHKRTWKSKLKKGEEAMYLDMRGVVENIQTEPQWIPCSERLPYSQEQVIVSIQDDAGDTRFNYTTCGWIITDKECWIVDDEVNNYVIAWMPLPEPYKGVE